MDYSLPVAKRTRSREALMFKEYYENLKKKKPKIGESESTTQKDASVKVGGKSIRKEDVVVGCGVGSESGGEHTVCVEESASVGGDVDDHVCAENLKKKNPKIGESESSTQKDALVKVGGKSIRMEDVVVGCGLASESGGIHTVSVEESASVGGDVDDHACAEGLRNLGKKDMGKSIVSEETDDTVPIMVDGSDDEVVFLGKNEDVSAGGCEDVVCLDDEEDFVGETSSFHSNNVAHLQSDLLEKHEDCVDDDDEEEEEEDDVFSTEEDNDDPDDDDYVVEKSESDIVEDTNSSSEEEEENYVGDSGVTKRGSNSEENWRRVEEQLDSLVDSDNTKDNKITKNSSVKVGRDPNYVAKQCRRKRTELGIASNPFSIDEEDNDNIDEEDRDLTTRLGHNDNLDGFNDETHQKVYITGPKKRSGRGSGDKTVLRISKKEKEKKSEGHFSDGRTYSAFHFGRRRKSSRRFFIFTKWGFRGREKSYR